MLKVKYDGYFNLPAEVIVLKHSLYPLFLPTLKLLLTLVPINYLSVAVCMHKM